MTTSPVSDSSSWRSRLLCSSRYLKYFRRWVGARRRCRVGADYFLVRDLETEHQILQNTCETHLKGIAPDSRLDELIENPFCTDWKGFDDQIRLWLWRSHSAFQQRLTEMMHGATKEQQQMLAIQEDRKIKHRTGFTLKKKDYTSTLTRIKEGNSVLLKLTQQNNELEPSRRSRSQAKVARLIRQLSRSTAVGCYGLVADVEHKFELYPQPNQPEARSFVTLRQVLEESEKGGLSPPFGYPEQLKLALALSTSVLHLYNTPWLARIVTLDDVVFLRETSLNYHSAYQPFVAKDFPPQPNSQPQQMHPPLPARLRPVDLTVLSLGTLLIQIITGRRIADLDFDLGGSSGSGTDLNSVLSKKEAASQLAGPVLQCGGMNYESAAQWCLGSILGVAGLEDDHFCQDFYEGVVARLEGDSRIQQQ
ncbi:hypothetical protein B0T26DRAFT_669387 [Lasiosphaeria miniovina]|uniref:DUF7580 domain-containing protein n=1 Tax=Lasiosphaeria miniovina TaxID=1954250 RepID=A0AA40BFD0_9PEZI|nr:uncharacterized protein B0T26DRAFT_669387 [Lasiosphaeria miniovina]KAK0732923.1 hypothetical protein B0T26DRAFT_669387 [Lasiosphaeria miniovina]